MDKFINTMLTNICLNPDGCLVYCFQTGFFLFFFLSFKYLQEQIFLLRVLGKISFFSVDTYSYEQKDIHTWIFFFLFAILCFLQSTISRIENIPCDGDDQISTENFKQIWEAICRLQSFIFIVHWAIKKKKFRET